MTLKKGTMTVKADNISMAIALATMAHATKAYPKEAREMFKAIDEQLRLACGWPPYTEPKPRRRKRR